MKAIELSGARKLADQFYNATIALAYGAPGFRLREKAFVDANIDVDLSERIVVVTGANAGLGFEIAKGVVARGGTCAMVCRNPIKAEAALAKLDSLPGNAELFLADLSSTKEAKTLVGRLLDRFESIDALVNNAGVMLGERQNTDEGNEVSYATNVLAGFILTEGLRPALARAAAPRVVHVTSGGMYSTRLSIDTMRDPTSYDGVDQYARTKRAQVVLNELWRPVLAEAGIFTAAMHPGWADTPGVQTSLPRFQKIMAPLLRTPAQGADTALWLCARSEVDLDNSGRLWFDRTPRKTHYMKRTVERQQERERLWDVVSSDCGLAPPS